MGASFNETVRETEEESGLMRGRASIRQEKRHRIGEGPSAIKVQDCEGIPHGKKKPYSDDEDD